MSPRKGAASSARGALAGLWRRAAGAGLALMIAGGTRLAAQTSDTTSSRASGFCFRGRPLSDCTDFPILELEAVEHTTATIGRRGDVTYLPSWAGLNVGMMHNTDASHAIGGAVIWDGVTSGKTDRFALVVRRRWWSSSRTAVDLEAGPLQVTNVGNRWLFAPGASYGATIGGAADLFNVIAITGHVDMVAAHGGVRPTMEIGLRSASYGSIAITALTLGWIHFHSGKQTPIGIPTF